MNPALTLANVTKSYGTQRVLSDVSLSIQGGSIVSLIGENGAGKSTLAKIIAGITTPDSGTISLFGQPVVFSHPAQAISAGIGIVHQEISVLDNLTVSENICLGREPSSGLFLDRREMNEIAARALATLSSSIAPTQRAGALSLAEKQILEIAKAVSSGAKLLIFDEPTSSLCDDDAERLLGIISNLRNMGVTVVYVSHRLSEVMRISDRVIALRDGALSGDRAGPVSDRQQLISAMIGREVRDMYGYIPRNKGPAVLEARSFRATRQHSAVDLTVHAGEIVGIAGLVGSGRSELLEALYGIRARHSGTVQLCSKPLPPASPVASVRAGLTLVPESRKEQGLVGDFSISDTIALTPTRPNQQTWARSVTTETRVAQEWITRLGIACVGHEQSARALSGGNQQKVVLAKCLTPSPSLLLLDEPTRGIDIAARRAIYQTLFSLAEQGLAILFVSSELEEVMGISDRILVMNHGRIAGELARSEFSERAIITLASHDASASSNFEHEHPLRRNLA